MPAKKLATRKKAPAAETPEIKADRLASAASAALTAFSTDSGRELLSYLWNRFGVTERVFLATPSGSLDTHRAAIRDGERAAISHIFHLIRKADPKFPSP